MKQELLSLLQDDEFLLALDKAFDRIRDLTKPAYDQYLFKAYPKKEIVGIDTQASIEDLLEQGWDYFPPSELTDNEKSVLITRGFTILNRPAKNSSWVVEL